MSSTNDGNSLSHGTGTEGASPLTEIYNSGQSTGTHWLFAGIPSNCAFCGSSTGCVESFNITSGFPATAAATGSSSGGTSGMVLKIAAEDAIQHITVGPDRWDRPSINFHRPRKLIQRRWCIGERATRNVLHEDSHRRPLITQEVVEFRQHQTGNVASAGAVDGVAKQECCSLKRAARRRTEGHLTAVLTNLPLRMSFWTFLHAAAASALDSNLRKIPSLNAFRTSNACKGVRYRGAPVWTRYALACGVLMSAM